MALSHHANLALAMLVLLVTCSAVVDGQLSSTFYSKSCPTLQDIVRNAVTKAANQDSRAPASLLRIFFHDCFVQGCDASLLLDGGEKNAIPNQSLRRFDIIDTIKTNVEAKCNGTVSCADILALATLEAVAAVGGPRWSLGLGRRDSLTAATSSVVLANIPSPFLDLPGLVSSFAAKGLSTTDLTALSGTHTIGQAQCAAFRPHLYNDTNIDASFAATRKANCPASGGDSNLAPLDLVSPTRFDNNYFKNLVAKKGLLRTDQALFGGTSQDALVTKYSTNQAAFFADLAAAMTKLSNLSPLTGTNGQIRKNCRVPN